MRYWFHFSSLNIVKLLISAWSIWSGGNVLYQSGISSRRANQRGWPLNISYMIHRVGRYGLMHTSNVVNNLTRSQTLLFVAKRLRRGLGNARISRIVVSQLIFSLLHSATVQGPKSYYCPTKRTYWLGIAERSIDNHETSLHGNPDCTEIHK